MKKPFKWKWKKMEFEDNSATWYEGQVDVLNWTYVVDQEHFADGYSCYLFVNDYVDDVKITKKTFKTVDKAKKFCEDHLKKTSESLAKLF